VANRAIFIVGTEPPPQTKAKILQLRSESKMFEIFLEEELMINITQHELVPEHILLTQEETDSLLAR